MYSGCTTRCNCCCCRTDSIITIRIVDTLFSKYNKRTELCAGKGSRRNNTLYTTYSLNSLCLSSSHKVLICQHGQVSPEPGSWESLGEVFTDKSGAAHQTITDMRWFMRPHDIPFVWFYCDIFGAGEVQIPKLTCQSVLFIQPKITNPATIF